MVSWRLIHSAPARWITKVFFFRKICLNEMPDDPCLCTITTHMFSTQNGIPVYMKKSCCLFSRLYPIFCHKFKKKHNFRSMGYWPWSSIKMFVLRNNALKWMDASLFIVEFKSAFALIEWTLSFKLMRQGDTKFIQDDNTKCIWSFGI